MDLGCVTFPAGTCIHGLVVQQVGHTLNKAKPEHEQQRLQAVIPQSQVSEVIDWSIGQAVKLILDWYHCL